MQLKLLNVILVCSMLPSTIFAQNDNPFKSIHKKSKVTSLSNDKYDEQFDKNNIQQIGSALVNIRTMKVVKIFKDEAQAQKYLDNTVSSRFLSIDPLTTKFAFYSPYQYAGNKPIWATDLDGLEEFLLPKYWELVPKLELPRLNIPIPPLPPAPPLIPSGFSMPQAPTLSPSPNIPLPPLPSIIRTTPIDESKINPNDANTYPEPPFSGEWKVSPIKPGTKGYEKTKDKDASRLENEKGDILRWHKADKYHPKGHWDFKEGGNNNNPWENYTPDGIQIPKGSIYGKDFNPAVNPFSIESLLKLLKQNGEQKEYQEKLKQYEKDKKQYDKDKNDYDKKLQQYAKDHPEALS